MPPTATGVPSADGNRERLFFGGMYFNILPMVLRSLPIVIRFALPHSFLLQQPPFLWMKTCHGGGNNDTGSTTTQGAKILHRDIKSNNLAFTAGYRKLKLFGKRRTSRDRV